VPHKHAQTHAQLVHSAAGPGAGPGRGRRRAAGRQWAGGVPPRCSNRLGLTEALFQWHKHAVSRAQASGSKRRWPGRRLAAPGPVANQGLPRAVCRGLCYLCCLILLIHHREAAGAGVPGSSSGRNVAHNFSISQ
jgi:hypothetical protein